MSGTEPSLMPKGLPAPSPPLTRRADWAAPRPTTSRWFKLPGRSAAPAGTT
jgi:hypothetical protein